MKPFSWFAFSSLFLMIGPSFKKNGCSHGLAVVPGPLVLEYSRERVSAFLYTVGATWEKFDFIGIVIMYNRIGSLAPVRFTSEQ